MNNNRLKLISAIAIALGLTVPVSASATDLAMANPGKHELSPAIESVILQDNYRGNLTRNPKMAYQLAQLYETGRGVEQNEEIAFRLYQYAALSGLAEAQYSLALMYSDERCPANVADAQQEAMVWLEMAARQGHQDAKFSYDYLLNNNHYAGC